jgi:hypothetical protein
VIAGLRSSFLAATAVALAWLGAPGTARADPSAELASSSAQRCLLPANDDRVKPIYPPNLYDARISGSVTAEFVFTRPDESPDVTLDSPDRAEFKEAIRVYARQLRVPCMAAKSEPVKLVQTFDFVPNDGRKVVWTTPADTTAPARKELSRCVTRPPADTIQYPEAMQREQRDAIVIARLRFFDPRLPPTFEMLSDGGHRSFGSAVTNYIDGLRMPCLAGDAIEQNWYFGFTIDDGGGEMKRRVLKDLPLSNFLAVVKPIKPDSVFFDTTAMKCPFDVRLTFAQPFEPNKLEELDEEVPARHAFLDWLGQREINLDVKHAGQFLGQQMTIHIPCGKIDL